jgi:uncharacterized protein (DUF2141 family)
MSKQGGIEGVGLRKRAVAGVALWAGVLVSGAAVAEESASKGQTVVVNVGTLRNQAGGVVCGLHSSNAGFPESSPGMVTIRTRPSGAVATCAFRDVPPGTYAVSVFHDENGNGKLDKNFVGVPSEGYGVSNNHTSAMSAPKWADAVFVVEPGKNKGLAIALRY